MANLDEIILQTSKEISYDNLHFLNRQLYNANSTNNSKIQDMAYNMYVNLTGLSPGEINENLLRYQNEQKSQR